MNCHLFHFVSIQNPEGKTFLVIVPQTHVDNGFSPNSKKTAPFIDAGLLVENESDAVNTNSAALGRLLEEDIRARNSQTTLPFQQQAGHLFKGNTQLFLMTCISIHTHMIIICYQSAKLFSIQAR